MEPMCKTRPPFYGVRDVERREGLTPIVHKGTTIGVTVQLMRNAIVGHIGGLGSMSGNL